MEIAFFFDLPLSHPCITGVVIPGEVIASGLPISHFIIS